MTSINRFLIFFLLLILGSRIAHSQESKYTVGAYYYDGWSGNFPTIITKRLVDSFPQREPKWGWITSKQEIMDEQIKLASSAGISFFSFCWYFINKGQEKYAPLNNALDYYLKSPNNSQLKFCLLIANHQGFELTPQNWAQACSEWVSKLKHKNHLMVSGKPLLIFYSIGTLIKNFGSESAVKSALAKLRLEAVKAGLPGISIAMCTDGTKTAIETAELCGFDILTGYNYHYAGFGKSIKTSIEVLPSAETKMWDKFVQFSKLKYIPVTTLNWDPRPWAGPGNLYDTAPYYVGFSYRSVYNSLNNCLNWIKKNKNTLNSTEENIALIYAWNENGEGAYLTPSKNGDNMLDGVKRALLNQTPSAVGP